jgi:two-component system sensor histidine kinase/response regulator
MARLDGVQTLRQIHDTLGAEAPRCVMATAYDPDVLQEELGDTPVAAIVQKPVTGKLLMAAIRSAFANDPAQEARVAQSSAPANLAALRKLLAGTHVLLVEDNLTNQELTVELLEAVGVTADVADDGAQALAMLANTSYALVLMDCQMPVMDGYEATRRLRAQAALTELPVIAMTASAMNGERERCLAAGMSDYLSKPIDLGLLYSKLVHWAPREGRTVILNPTAVAIPSPAVAPTTVPASLPVLDEVDALRRTNEDMALYERLLRMFCDREADMPLRLEEALSKGDQESALRTVHSLKGISATIGAYALAKASLDLETELKQPSAPPASVMQATQRWTDALTDVLNHIQQRTPRAEAQVVAATSMNTATPIPMRLLMLCRELQVLLQASDVKASRSAEALSRELQTTVHADAAGQIARLAGRFDYDDALDGLQTLMANLA